MLYSVKLKLDKDYIIKIGTRQLIDLQKSGISIETASTDIEESYKFLHKCLRNVDGTHVKMTLDELIDKFDESEMAWFELQDIIVQAYKLGVNKGKEQPETEKKT